jgi:two-component system, response regulator YesN
MRFGRYFVRLFLNSFLIVVVPILIVGYVSYGLAARVVKTKVSDVYLRSLERTQKNLDERLRGIKNTLYQSSENPYLDRLRRVRTEPDASDLFAVMKLIEVLDRARSSDSLIRDFLVYLRGMDVVVDAATMHETSVFLERHFVLEAGRRDSLAAALGAAWSMSFEVLGRVLRAPTASNPGPVVAESAVVVLRSLPLGVTEPPVVLAMLLDTDALREVLASASLSPSMVSLVLRPDGQVVCASRDAPVASSVDARSELLRRIRSAAKDAGSFSFDMAGGSRTVMYQALTETNWYLVNIVDTGEIVRDATIIRNITLQVGLLALALGGTLSYLLARRMYRPINVIMSRLDEGGGRAALPAERRVDELGVIGTELFGAMARNMQLEGSLAGYLPMARERFFYHLAKANYRSSRAIESQLKELRIELRGGGVLACVLEIDHFLTLIDTEGETQVHYLLTMIAEYAVRTLQDTFASTFAFYDEHRVGIFVDCDLPDAAAVHERALECARRVRAIANTDLHLSLTIGVGAPGDGIMAFAASYTDACRAVESKFFAGCNQILVGTGAPVVDEPLPVRRQGDEALENRLKAGEAAAIVADVEAALGADRAGTDAPAARDVLAHVLALAFDTAVRMNSEGLGAGLDRATAMRELERCETLAEALDTFGGILTRVGAAVTELCRSHDARAERIIEYLRANCARPITLTSVAEEFGFSSSYLSSYVRKATGATFLDTLMQIRVDRAKELLKQAAHTSIEVVARDAGFGSYRAFVRAFKKQVGLSPLGYRRLHD